MSLSVRFAPSCQTKVSKPSDANLALSARQWRLADSLVSVLRPFKRATRILSGEQYVTLSSSIPVMEGLYRGLDKGCRLCRDGGAVITEVKDRLKEELNPKF